MPEYGRQATIQESEFCPAAVLLLTRQVRWLPPTRCAVVPKADGLTFSRAFAHKADLTLEQSRR